jgi:hypothetical protein
MEQERLKMYQLLKGDEVTDLGFSAFVSKYFATEDITKNLYDDLISKKSPRGEFYYSNSVGDFFKKYACDLFPNSTYCGGSGSATTTPGTNVFACIEAEHNSGKKYTADRTQLHITRANGSKHIFINDYKFIYLHNKVKHGGTWICDGPTSYKITLKNGQTYSPNVGKWSDKPEVVEVPPSNGKAESTKKSEGAKTTVTTKSKDNKVIYGTDAIIY